MTKPNLPLQHQRLMSLRRLAPSFQLDVVSPDGIPIIVGWDTLGIGMSVFILALNHTKLNKQVKDIAKQKGFIVEGRSRIEGEKYGMRFWRIA